jgi:hypothetical protein
LTVLGTSTALLVPFESGLIFTGHASRMPPLD